MLDMLPDLDCILQGIGKGLRADGHQITREPIPERLAELIRRIDEAERSDGKP